MNFFYGALVLGHQVSQPFLIMAVTVLHVLNLDLAPPVDNGQVFHLEVNKNVIGSLSSKHRLLQRVQQLFLFFDR